MNLFSVLALYLCGHRKLIPDIAVVFQKGLFRVKMQVKRHLVLDFVLYQVLVSWGLPYSSDGKESAYNAGDLGSVPGSGRSGEGNGNPLQNSCLENPRDRGAWRAKKSQTRLSDNTHTLVSRDPLLPCPVTHVRIVPVTSASSPSQV